MNLFFKRLFGQLHSTERMERQIMADEERIARYRQVENSAELKEYLQLKQIVESPEFKQKKRELKETDYKSTPTYATIKEYKDLLNNKELQMFLEMEKSERLRRFLEFRKSEDYVRLQSEKDVRNSLELKQMKEFEDSKEYKSYLTYRDSPMPARFKALVAEVATDEYKKQHAFWSNPDRWKTTNEYQQEVRFKQLAAMADIVFYLQQDKQELDRLMQRRIVFSDEFGWRTLSDSQWRAGFGYDNPKLLRVHSFVNEQQANSGGRNVGTVDNKLTLFTKREKAASPAWDAKKGFVSKDFDYTSDIITTADTFRQKGGLFMAKIRITGKIHHALWLGSGKKLPVISLFHFNGKKIVVGSHSANGFNGEVIGGISAEKYYIYSLRWTDRELIWSINNIEVFRTSRDVPQEQLYLAISSFIDEHQRASEGQINVAWVRVYADK